MNANLLKIIGVIAMTFDHVGFFLFPKEVILRIMGRIAYPIFAYFIAEGCTYTKHQKKYFSSILLVGMLCSAVSYLAERSLYQSIMITFACSIGLIFSFQYALGTNLSGSSCTQPTSQSALAKKPSDTSSVSFRWLAVFYILLAAYYLLFHVHIFSDFTTDYGFWGILTPFFIWLGKNKRQKLFALAFGLTLLYFKMGSNQIYSFLATPLLMLYNGQRGKWRYKSFFYIYYPLHIAIINGIAGLLQTDDFKAGW